MTDRRADAAGQMEDVTVDIDPFTECVISGIKRAIIQGGDYFIAAPYSAEWDCAAEL